MESFCALRIFFYINISNYVTATMGKTYLCKEKSVSFAIEVPVSTATYRKKSSARGIQPDQNEIWRSNLIDFCFFTRPTLSTFGDVEITRTGSSITVITVVVQVHFTGTSRHKLCTAGTVPYGTFARTSKTR
jgi:hypothetical protein